MPTRAAQYLNEIVSLSIMSLLIVALAAGEVDRTHDATASRAPLLIADQDFSFRHDGE